MQLEQKDYCLSLIIIFFIITGVAGLSFEPVGTTDILSAMLCPLALCQILCDDPSAMA